MKFKKLAYYFIPHHKTHVKAHLLSWHFLIIYILIFLLVRVGIDLVSIYRPGVLGVSSNITVTEIIQKVNQERQKKGLPVLKENQFLDEAANAKAKNMFEENYWAHFSPSGRDPWGFIKNAGYKFVYAGENLARNFYTADEVVKAWMDSPSHRDNILNPKYQDIGIVVTEGILQGQKTTLIVQMFGTSYQSTTAVPSADLAGEKIVAEETPRAFSKPVLVARSRSTVLPARADPFIILRAAGIFLIFLIAVLLVADFLILKKRGVFRLSSHHLAHLSLLALVGLSLLLSKAGGII